MSYCKIHHSIFNEKLFLEQFKCYSDQVTLNERNVLQIKPKNKLILQERDLLSDDIPSKLIFFVTWSE